MYEDLRFLPLLHPSEPNIATTPCPVRTTGNLHSFPVPILRLAQLLGVYRTISPSHLHRLAHSNPPPWSLDAIGINSALVPLPRPAEPGCPTIPPRGFLLAQLPDVLLPLAHPARTPLPHLVADLSR
ncbi:hypothetical protein HGRIS_003333 [Hohenbuehelia grisea]|uniref:Uncharacterized protein n=1 Tax=Hohenbuehelia grisea TaxID=104357 RepID=A0ABR3JF24_9AGAR